ncbi:tRNA pseudouridine(55) synthase TruB [Streptomyces kaniharaensis]|uniref:tRNA pseudouridine synthase B n=1 Tax=Streptomyces kaniharaensis TaxID=212423 RepID=A0A6N7KLL9_9ACTN|nr:tRNA pseudouridine(55) synthase TruB [Streptomyces kaniharaensis]MQS12291.1 tRNA pseudouridine(55) synthase TruB [Streptomyces kaniharaensis]
MKRKGTGPDGLVIVDKPEGITSHGVVAKMRWLAGTRKVGHAGTLDPMATGVLVIGVERATRLLGHLMLTAKTYEATIRLGQTTVTDDREGEVTSSTPADGVSRESIEAGIAALTGEIMQVPSKVSAIKIDGKRSYARVREGEDFELAARPTTIHSFTVHQQRAAVAEDGTPVIDLDVTVECSSGTYIRALARDLGAGLGVGGHLTALRRTKVGPYGVESARTLEQLEAAVTGDSATGLEVLPIADAAAAAFPRWDLDAGQAEKLSHGARLKAPGLGVDGPIAAFGPDGRFLALVEETGGQAKPVAVFVG